MTDSTQALRDYYAAAESSFAVTSESDFRQMVVPNGNSEQPVHRWFHLKEAFSCDLLRRLVHDLGYVHSDGLTVLDPFAGVGTTATSLFSMAEGGELSQPSVYGIETNPYLHLVADTKSRAYQEEAPRFLEVARDVAERAYSSTKNYQLPALSTLRNPHYFDPLRLQDLLRIRQSIAATDKDQPSLVGDLLRLALGSIVEAASNLRRDGRALRYTNKEPSIHPIDMFLHKCEQIDEDLPATQPKVQGRVLRGDGITMRALDNVTDRFDLIIFSPPYPNNIDYTEIYKLENWILAMIKSEREFRDQRLCTLHSHPSLRRPNRLPDPQLTPQENATVASVIKPILAVIPRDRYMHHRTDMVQGYFLDMYRTLRSASRRLKPSGRLVYVVGNSAHGTTGDQFVIAADLMIARIATFAGFSVERFIIARQLKRRSLESEFLRESIVILTASHPTRPTAL